MHLYSLSPLLLAAYASAATVTYNWAATWVNAAPDGVSRPLIGINGVWPCPKIEANVGDTIVVNLENQLGNETTGLHFHGMAQFGTTFMDGPTGVTQCPVPPGSSITYSFLADAPGSYWYHSHNMGQYPDGLRGPLIIQDPSDPYTYDEEVILTVSDWYHSQSVDLVRNMLTTSNVHFLPPFPDNILINEGQGANVTFVVGKTYRFRIISFSAFASVMVHFDSHTMQVIMNDGTYVQQAQAYQLRVAPAQRYDVLITAISRDHRNYPYLLSLDMNRDYTVTASNVWPFNYTGYLVMDPNGALPQDVVAKWQPVNDADFLPFDNQVAYGPVAQTIQLDFNFCTDANGYPRACFNNQTYIGQKVPTLYSVSSTGTDNTNPAIYGDINPFFLNYGDVVNIVVNNLDAAIHPFHLHGHQFQVLDRPGSNTGKWSGHNRTFPAIPPRRDTVAVNANSYAVLRIVANNPGVQLFHCHIEWHVEMGLTVTLIEAPDHLRDIQIPSDHLANCAAQGIPTAGNAAGNTATVTDTSGFNTVPPTTYNGALYTSPTPAARFRPRALKVAL